MAQNFCLLAISLALVLSACAFPPTSTPTPVIPDNAEPINPESVAVTTLELTISVDPSVTFNAVDQTITYNYLVKNTGSQSVPGPAGVNDDRAATSCPEITSVGNNDANLDPTEEVTCTGTYKITQADLDAGSVTNNATATVGGVSSNAATFAANMTQNKALTLSKAANPTTYNQLGQAITYTYVITNSGNVTLQGTFSVSDDKVTTANCTQPGDGALSPNEQMSCTATYSITQADLAATSVTNNASASEGTITSANVTTTVNKSGTGIPPVIGESRQHTVVKGEWLWQIARCYGANPREVINANLQLYHPAKLFAGMVVTVPNVGSVGPILGPPCIHWHQVVSGDTWASIAQKFTNIDINFIQRSDVNPRGLVPGIEVRVPVGPLKYP